MKELNIRVKGTAVYLDDNKGNTQKVGYVIEALQEAYDKVRKEFNETKNE